MLNVLLQRHIDSELNVLCLGAHCDDIEIGCGGTVLKMIEQYQRTNVCWVVFGSDERRAEEAKSAANKFLSGAAAKTVIIHKFRNSFFPYQGSDIKTCFEDLKSKFSPNVVLTHYRNDLHQDHRVISDLSWNTWRDHLILEYEIPKYDGDMGSPNAFFCLDSATARKKIGYILESFPSQNGKHWFDEETFLATLRLRGVESASPEKYAEGFYCRKLILT